MTEVQIGEILLDLALLFGLAYLLAGLLERVRIPGILGALFVGMALHYTPLGARLLSPEIYGPLTFLAQLGVLFLLFYIGLQIDLVEMRAMSGDIIWCTILNTAVPFLLGMAVMLALGYGWTLAFVIGLTRMPTAEAVVVPILDEFHLIRTRVGEFIVGVGTLDDVLEVFMVAVVSVWIGEKAGGSASGLASDVLGIVVGLLVFVSLAWISYRWLIPSLNRWLPRQPRNLILLAMLVLFGFGGLSEYASLGMVVGAITAGILMRPAFDNMAGEQTMQVIRAISYGFLGLVFFFWVGISADLAGVVQAPTLAILLYLAGTLGKLIGVFLMVPMGKLNVREAWTIGVGLDARLTTEIIVAQLLLGAQLIDAGLFTALVTAASFTALTVPVVFSLLLRRWGDQLRALPTARE
ncbi:MAG: cation:proton antiporter [Nitrospirales bacterium]|jgi:Ca2+-transporting ATPase